MARYSQEEQREFREIENSRIRALLFLMERNFRIAAVHRRQASPNYHYELATQRALFFLRSAKELKAAGETVFSNKHFRYALGAALKRDDLSFFVSVGRVISREQEKFADISMKAFACSALEGFLINFWCEQIDADSKPLCFLSMKELCEACTAHLPNTDGLNEKLIHNTWRNLGLKRAKRVIFKGRGLHRLKVFRSGLFLKSQRVK